MVLTLMRSQTQDGHGVSRQGGSGIGGGAAAGRHRAYPAQSGPSILQRRHSELSCVGCGGTVSGVAVVVQSRVYCGDCAVTTAHPVPGLYFG